MTQPSEQPQFSLTALIGFITSACVVLAVASYLNGFGGYFNLIGPVAGSIAYLFAPMWLMATFSFVPMPRFALKHVGDLALVAIFVGASVGITVQNVRYGSMAVMITIFIWGPQMPAYYLWRRGK